MTTPASYQHNHTGTNYAATSATWLLTATGAQFDLRHIDPGHISPLDIAHHLAQINRFTGACMRPMSVAEHSLLVLAIVETTLPAADPAILLAALMHDAHEAYTSDLGTPMKNVVGDAWRMEENRIQRAVLQRFNLVDASASARKLIHWADRTALVTERKHLLPHTGPAWEAERLHEPYAGWNFPEHAKFGWADWRDMFIERFAELEYARKAARPVLVGGTPQQQPTTPT